MAMSTKDEGDGAGSSKKDERGKKADETDETPAREKAEATKANEAAEQAPNEHVHRGGVETDPQSPYFGKWDGSGLHVREHRDYGVEELLFAHIGDRLRVSLLDDRATCAPGAMMKELKDLLASSTDARPDEISERAPTRSTSR